MSALREILAHFGIEVDTEQLEKGEKAVGSFIGRLKEVGEAVMTAFAVEKVKEFIMGMAEAAEKLELQAVSLGTSTEALQEWQFAASMVGVGADQLSGAMMRLERAAAGGGKGGGGALAKLKIDAKDAHGEIKPVTQLFDEVADKIEKIENPAKRTQIAMQLFGRSGAKLIPLLEQGSAGIKKFRDEVKALGGGMNEDFIKKSKEMLQNSKRLGMAWESLKVNIVGELLPAFTQLIMWMTKGAVVIMNLMKETSALQAIVVILGVTAVAALSAMLGPLGALLLELAPLIIAFLLLDDAITFLRGGDSEIGRAIDAMFGEGKAEAFRKGLLEAIDTIKVFFDLVMGNTTEATEKWKREWEDSKQFIIKGFGGVGSTFVWLIDLLTGGWDNAWSQIKAIFNLSMAILNAGWLAFKHFGLASIYGIEDAFGSFVNGLLSGMQLVLKSMQKVAEALGKADVAADIGKGVAAITMNTSRGARSDAAYAEESALNDKAVLAYADQIAGVKTVSKNDLDTVNNRHQEITQKVDVHVNVPHGTPHEVARDVGNAAEEGVNRANAAALIPGDG